MLVTINMTGLKKTYWIPVVKRDAAPGIWYVDVRFLFVQVTIYNKKFGAYVLRLINNPPDKETLEKIGVFDDES